MDRRSSRARVRASLAAAAAACTLAALPAVAGAQTTSDLTDWNLTESVSTWGTLFHITVGGGQVAYRWLDSPNKATVISGNSCADYTLYGSDTLGVGDTSYHNLFVKSPGTCFVLRGRTTVGSGSMVDHDGRVSR
jgi:hypothetical protein